MPSGAVRRAREEVTSRMLPLPGTWTGVTNATAHHPASSEVVRRQTEHDRKAKNTGAPGGRRPLYSKGRQPRPRDRDGKATRMSTLVYHLRRAALALHGSDLTDG